MDAPGILNAVFDEENNALSVTFGEDVTVEIGASVEISNDVGNPIPVNGTVAVTGVATEATLDARTGSLTEVAPATDTASSGINGRLQRIAQRLTSAITLLAGGLPAALGAGGGLKVDGSGTALPISGTVTASNAAGDIAHDTADSGNPVKVGAKAVSAEPAAVTANDRVNLIADLVGKLITAPYTNPENIVSGAITSAMTGTTSTSLVASPGAGLRNYLTTIIVSNAHATVGTDVVIQDGSGGTTLLTIPAAAVYGGASITLPVPLRQPTTNTDIYCACVTTGASVKVSAVGYKGV